jgi:hypothetical protein
MKTYDETSVSSRTNHKLDSRNPKRTQGKYIADLELEARLSHSDEPIPALQYRIPRTSLNVAVNWPNPSSKNLTKDGEKRNLIWRDGSKGQGIGTKDLRQMCEKE